MATPQVGTVVHRLRRAVLRLDDAGRTDGQLLASFVEQKDAAAFEALLHRHAAMVFGVCRRVVGNHHDAEDAFQATFLVLARKSGSVRPRDRLASWLHGVALRTAMKARTLAAKRRGREQQVIPMPEPAGNRHDPWTDLQPVLDQELNGLPENYRLPILLCDLEGKTIKEATEQLGWPQGTFASRLVRGRKLLARRLTSRGITLSGGALALVVCRHAASAAMPASLMSSTVKAAALAAGQAALAGVVPAKVALLTEGVLKTMLWSKLKTLTATFLVLSLPLVGGGLWTTRSAIAQQAAPPAQAKPQPPAPPAAKIDPVARLMELAAFYEQTGHPKTAAFYRQLAADAQKKAGDGQRPPLPVAPKAEVERQYAITARLVEVGANEVVNVLAAPKLVLLDGQPGVLVIEDDPQKLQDNVSRDEKLKIGTFIDVRVKRLAGNKVRMVFSFQRNQLEKSLVPRTRVLGHTVQTIEELELHETAKIVFRDDGKGTALSWLQITVDEWVSPDDSPATAPPAAKKGSVVPPVPKK